MINSVNTKKSLPSHDNVTSNETQHHEHTKEGSPDCVMRDKTQCV